MTREEAINWFEAFASDYYDPMEVPDDLPYEVAEVALAALRGPNREQAEKVRGEWMPTETPFMNECEDCSKCGFRMTYGHGFQFCPSCGAPMTDEAVDMMLERWKEAVDNPAIPSKDNYRYPPKRQEDET